MRVFVAGANGAIGRRLVPMLVASGHEVTGTTTSRKSAEAIQAMGAEPVIVDGLDAAGIGEAVAAAEPDAAGVSSSSLGGEQATTVAAAKPIMARAPARRVKELVMLTSRS